MTIGEITEYPWTVRSSRCDRSGHHEQAFRLAHISDPHLSSLHRIHWHELLNKRLLGYVWWRWRRRSEHLPGMLDALQRDLAASCPDHIAVTGDLVHLGTPAECREARAWLERLGPPGQITVIPGNHDRYAFAD